MSPVPADAEASALSAFGGDKPVAAPGGSRLGCAQDCSAALLMAGRGRAQRPGGAPELWQVQLCHGLGFWVHRGAQAGQGWGQSGEVKAKQRAGCVQSCWLHPPGQAADGISLQEMEVALWMKTLNKTFSLKCFGVSMTKGLLELLFSLGRSAQGVMGTSCSRGCSLHSGYM